jgi:hypothetical protein
VSAVVQAIAIGATAHAALARTGGAARVLARLRGTTYATAGETIVWVGEAWAMLHPRAILSEAPVAAGIDDVRVEAAGVTPWRPPPLVHHGAGRARLAQSWAAFAPRIVSLGAPGGFGVLLAGAPLAFPLDGAAGPALALAHACAGDDPDGTADAALALLGLGGGLTPSGDDFVGGALFARAALATEHPAWRRVADVVVTAAAERTHPISAALLADLAAGLGGAPLHELLAALTAGDISAAETAARSLVSLGHTSGWDVLAGLAAGLGMLAGRR